MITHQIYLPNSIKNIYSTSDKNSLIHYTFKFVPRDYKMSYKKISFISYFLFKRFTIFLTLNIWITQIKMFIKCFPIPLYNPKGFLILRIMNPKNPFICFSKFFSFKFHHTSLSFVSKRVKNHFLHVLEEEHCVLQEILHS